MGARITKRKDEVTDGVKAQAAERFMSFLVTTATDPQAVSFEALGLPNMADAAYRVLVHNEGLTLAVDESTKATTGFNIINGTGAEIANVFVHGNVDEGPVS